MIFKYSDTGNVIVKGKLRFDVKDITNKHKHQRSSRDISTSMVMLDFDYQGFYKSLLNLRFNKDNVGSLNLMSSLRGSHVTFIKEPIKNRKFFRQAKNFFEGQEIELELDFFTGLQFSEKHCWFRVHENTRSHLYKIRKSCGLKEWFNLHMTVGRIQPTFGNISKFQMIKKQYYKYKL